MPHHSPADLVFTNGPVLTLDAARTRATTVAVTGERITAVGHDEIRDLVGPKTEVVDLAGKLLLPGFQDAHIHPVPAGLELAQCDLTGSRTAAETVAAVRAYARSRPEEEWITGGGWSMEAFEGGSPTKDLLDAVVPDRPVYLPNRDHHGAWANSRALDLAGIDRTTPDPADGRIERDTRGEPTGLLQEGAMDLVARLTPPSTPADRLAALLRAQRCSTRTASPPGRTPSSEPSARWTTPPTRTSPPPATDRSPPASPAPCGGTATAAPSRSPDSSPAARN